MPAIDSKGWALNSRPIGAPTPDNFSFVDQPAPAPSEGQIQVRNTFLSVDPYMRGRMNDRESYIPPFVVGEIMTGGAVGRVTASRHPDYAEGDLVQSMAGWREAWTAPPDMVMAQKLPGASGLPDSAFLGIVGMPGLTAYAGILRVAALKEGDTVFVSGAAGAVGSTVVQIAKIKNCRVIGSAGGPDKCALVKSLGADECIDYKIAGGFDGLVNALRAAAPQGLDVYFDNVGGDHLQAAIECARPMGRMALCGMIEQYNAEAAPTGPNNMIQIVGKQLTLRGLIVSSHADMAADFQRDMTSWITSGKMSFKETVMNGIEATPDAFLCLFSGKNTGKMVVKL